MIYLKTNCIILSDLLPTFNKNLRLFLIALLAFLFSFSLNAQSCSHDHHHGGEHTAPLKFIENQNQWHENIKYQVEIGGMNMLFLEKNTLTWLFRDQSVTQFLHDHPDFKDTIPMDAHAYKINFLGSGEPTLKGFDKQNTYHNYFLGNEKEKWAGSVPVFEGVEYDELYPGIDLKAYSQYGNFKYDLVVEAGIDPTIIQLEYDGTDGMEVKDGRLHIQTSLEEVIEQRPFAYQIIDSFFVDVVCEYKLENNILTFDLPNGYDKKYPLVIDPVVIAATRSGSLSDNWGFSATFDNAGNIYAGGISFDAGYPTTTGAFQITHGGGARDIAVTKYNPDGSQQIYATYIGGTANDHPHSMIVDFSGQLCIYGTSDSQNYPTTSNSIQPVKAAGIDIIVTKLNATGTDLVGSTFLGGDDMDGNNRIGPSGQAYDENRGEIVLDAQGNIYIASASLSNNFPTTANAFQTISGGDQEGVVFKMNSDLSTLFWSTYIGKSEDDSAMALRVNGDGRIVVIGTTENEDFPVGDDGHEPNWPGGTSNVYVIKLSPDGQNIEQGTFFGSTDGTDYGYFIDTDEDRNVHIYGQTTGTIDITPNTYFANAGSKQFLAAFKPNLDDIVYSTVIGNGPNSFGFDFVPVAFMVDKCNGIYFSAFGAVSGLPVTDDAINIGDDFFYLAKLSPNAETMDFGTYYGESFHVDGGTSRFDKAGIVYQAVCSCSPFSVMNTLPNAYSQVSSPNCSIGVFKIDFEIETVTASAFAEPGTSGCAPLTIDFQYTGSDAETFFWDFGTGTTSIDENPTHTFAEPGTYSVMQIVNAPSTCNQADTFFLQIDVLDNNSTLKDTAFCPGSVNLFLDVTTSNAIYTWQDGATGATYSVQDVGTYWVDVDIGNCVRRDSFVVSTATEINLDLGADQLLCDVNEITLNATDNNGAVYQWNSGETSPILNITNSGLYAVTIFDSFGCSVSDEVEIILGNTPIIELGTDTTLCAGEPLLLTPSTTSGTITWQDGTNVNTYDVTSPGLYWIEVDDQGCSTTDSLIVAYDPLPIVDFNTEDIDCNGNTNGLIEPFFPQSVSEFDFQWSTGSSDIGLSDLIAGNYEVIITDDNDCVYETTLIISEPDPIILDVLIEDVECFADQNGSISLANASGGTTPYMYSFNGGDFTSNPILAELNGGTYTIELLDANDCAASTEVFVYEPPEITLSAGDDKVIELGDSVRLDGIIFPDLGQEILWESFEYVNCETCLRPFGIPVNTADYVLTYRDTTTGCTHIDTMNIFVEKPRNIFIPNVFTPNGDGFNDLFYPFGDQSVERVNYMKIFDRWGEFVYEANDFDVNDPGAAWDGLFKGKNMQPAVFVYVIEMVFKDDFVGLYKGDVTLVR